MPRPNYFLQYYKLDADKHVVPCSLFEWAQRFEDGRRVGWTEFDDGTFISTVFLGIDHRFGGNGPPLLFETMAFDRAGKSMEDKGWIWRYSSWDDAKTGHAAAVRRLARERGAMARENVLVNDTTEETK